MAFYEEYMSSNEWRLKRFQRLQFDSFQCQTCLETESLEVHHKTYERLGNEDVEHDLITLCTWCHEAITSSRKARGYKKKVYKPTIVKQEIITNGMARERVQIEVAITAVNAQWADGRSKKPIRKILKANIIEANKDRCRL